jgi:hypothetical protein
MSRYESDIGPLKKRFWIAAGLLLLAAMICISQIRNRLLQEKTRSELVRAKAGLALLREASVNRKQALDMLKAMYMQGASSSSERLIYGKIDELSARLKPDDVTFSTIERKEGEVSLQFSFKFINPNYNDFLNNVSYLEGSVFPLTMVSAVAITQAEVAGKSVLSCSITGKVLTSESRKP